MAMPHTIEDYLVTFVKQSTLSFDESHGLDHALKVTNNAIDIATKLDAGCDIKFLRFVAMLHDVRDHKYSDSITSDQLYQFINLYYDDYDTGRILDIINNISYSKQIKGKRNLLIKIDQIYLDIVSDADRLEAIGQIGLDRCITYTLATGGKVPEDVITHCHEKLLRLLPDGFIVTEPGKELAEPLHQVIVDYCSNNP